MTSAHNDFILYACAFWAQNETRNEKAAEHDRFIACLFWIRNDWQDYCNFAGRLRFRSSGRRTSANHAQTRTILARELHESGQAFPKSFAFKPVCSMKSLYGLVRHSYQEEQARSQQMISWMHHCPCLGCECRTFLRRSEMTSTQLRSS